MADSSDKLKRNRGRRGLDMLKRMQTNPKIELVMHEGNLAGAARRAQGGRAAGGAGEGAQRPRRHQRLQPQQDRTTAGRRGDQPQRACQLRSSSVALPGELMALNAKIVKPGDQIGQGVGYLEDGTMVVVEQGRSR
jgi:hypothetical protein